MHAPLPTIVLSTILAATTAITDRTAADTMVVFDLSPFTADSVSGEIIGVTTAQGEIVGARLEVVFVSIEDDPWEISVAFQFPTGLVGVDSATEGWSGQGTFRTSFDTDALNGFLAPSPGSPFAFWFVGWTSLGPPMKLPGGGVSIGPVDGFFETLTLTLTLAGCAEGDLNADGLIDGADLGLLLAAWGDCEPMAPPVGCVGDFNDDFVVDGADLGILLGNWASRCEVDPCQGPNPPC